MVVARSNCRTERRSNRMQSNWSRSVVVISTLCDRTSSFARYASVTTANRRPRDFRTTPIRRRFEFDTISGQRKKSGTLANDVTLSVSDKVAAFSMLKTTSGYFLFYFCLSPPVFLFVYCLSFISLLRPYVMVNKDYLLNYGWTITVVSRRNYVVWALTYSIHLLLTL